MRTQKLRNWMGVCLLAAFLFSSVLSLFPAPKVSATHQIDHGNLQWVNASTIKFGDINLIDVEPGDGTMDFTTNGNQDGCFSTLNGFGSGRPLGGGMDKSSAHLTIRQRDNISRRCETVSEGDVRINSVPNANLWFNWVDAGHVEPVFGDFDRLADLEVTNGTNYDAASVGGVWEKIEGEGNTFGPQSGGCRKMTLVLQPGASTARLQLRDGGSCDVVNTYDVRIGNVAAASIPAGEGTPTAGGGTGNGEAVDNAPTCESEGGALSWVMCPVIMLIDSALNWVDTQIQALLEIDSNYYENPGIRGAFASIRNIAFIILVPIVLVMVIGTALGFDFVSAYTVKRAMPRLVIAVIFISLSYQICVFLIDMFNALGGATLGIITAPFAATLGDVNGITLASMFSGEILTGIITGVVGGVAAILALWLFGGTLLLGAGVAFLVLIFRQMLLIVLMLAAPLAILAWIFPGNDKLWKSWWSSFSKLLIMYPLIMALIAMGRIFAFTVHQSSAAGLDGTILQPIFTIIAYMIPYAAIPFTFKFAGGLFATVAGMANDRSKGMFDRQRQKRADKRQRIANQQMFKGAPKGSVRSKLNTFGAGAMNLNKTGVGLTPGTWRMRSIRANMGTAIGNNSINEAAEAADKNMDYQSWKGDDDLNKFAAQSRNGTELRKLLTDNGYAGGDKASIESAVARVERVRKQMSEPAFKQMTTLSAIDGGTAYKDAGEAWAAVAAAAGNDDAALATLVAKGRNAAEKAGRFDQGGAGFGATFGVAQEFRNQLRTGTGIGSSDANERALALQAGTNATLDSVIDSSGAGKAIYGKPTSAKQLAQAHTRRVTSLLDSLNTGSTMNIGGEQRVATDRDVKQALASAAGIHDALGGASPQNARAFADGFMGQGLNVSSLTPQARAALGPAFARQGAGQSSTGPDGNVTFRQAIEGLQGNDQTFSEMRRDYASQTTEAAARSAPQPGAMGPPPAPGGIPKPPGAP